MGVLSKYIQNDLNFIQILKLYKICLERETNLKISMKFILVLKNFRCFKDKKINLSFNENEEFFYINGKSGSGKSTILYAIYFVLYGTLRKPFTFGEEKCNVKLYFDNIKIKREKRPNRLIVIVKEDNEIKKYLDSEAQGFINNFFNEKEYFFQSSFIEQKNLNSFLYQSSSKQLEAVEKLCYYNLNPILLLSKIKERIKNLDKDLLIKNTEKNILKKEFKKKKKYKIKPIKPVESIEKFNIEYEKIILSLKDKREKYFSLLSVFEKEKILKSFKTKLLKLLNLYNSNKKDYKSLVEHKNFIFINKENLDKEIKDKEEKIKNINNILKFNSLLKDYYDIIEKERKNKEDILSSLKLLDNADKINKELYEKILLKQKYDNILMLDKKIKKEMNDRDIKDFTSINKKEELEKLENRKIFLKERLNELYTRECPVCKTKLLLIDEALEVSNVSKIEINNNKKKEIEKELKDIEILKQKLLGEINVIDIVIYPLYIEYENLKKSLSDMNNHNINDLDKDIKNIENILYDDKLARDLYQNTKDELDNNKYSYFIISLEEKIKKLYKKLNRNEEFSLAYIAFDINEIEKLKSESKDIKEKIDNIKNLEYECKAKERTIFDIKTNIKELKKDINNLNEDEINKNKKLVKILDEEIKELEEDVKNKDKIKEDIKKWQCLSNNRKNYLSLKRKIKDLMKDEKEILLKIRNLNIIKKHCITAQNTSLINTINIINDKTNYFLSFLFKDVPINVKLDFKKDKLYINIIYNGIEYDLLSFSGGEKDRLNLAFTLAFNFMFDSKILMLDECLSSLDSLTFEDIIVDLKNILRDKIVIIVSHHYIDENVFDKVLNLY